MTSIEQHDKDVETVLKYLYQHRRGYMADLEKLNKPDIIKELSILGMLNTGYTPKKKTYSITLNGIIYYKTVFRQK